MRKRRAVIYDDDISVLNFFKDFFEMNNYEVICNSIPKMCPVHEKEYSVCPQEFPCADILLSDLNMEPLDGISLLMAQSMMGCKIDARNKAIMSGNLRDEDIKICTENNIKFYHKPFDIKVLTAWINECEKRMNLLIPLECRRTETRIAFNKEIIFVTGIDTKSKGFLLNMSRSGFCIKVQKPLFVNQVIKIKSTMPVECKNAMVRWVDRNMDNSYIAGILCS